METRSSDGLGHRPAALNPRSERRVADSYAMGPISKTQRFSNVREEHVCSLVSILGHASCPSAVAWFVIAIVIDPVYGMRGRRSRPHVCIEVGEGISPALTEADAVRDKMDRSWNALDEVDIALVDRLYYALNE